MSLFPIKRGWKPKRGNGDTVKKRRGRPTNEMKHIDPTVKAIRVSAEIADTLDDWKKRFHVKTYDQAIRKYMKEHQRSRTNEFKLQKNVEALESELLEQQPVKSTNKIIQEVLNK